MSLFSDSADYSIKAGSRVFEGYQFAKYINDSSIVFIDSQQQIRIFNKYKNEFIHKRPNSKFINIDFSKICIDQNKKRGFYYNNIGTIFYYDIACDSHSLVFNINELGSYAIASFDVFDNELAVCLLNLSDSISHNYDFFLIDLTNKNVSCVKSGKKSSSLTYKPIVKFVNKGIIISNYYLNNLTYLFKIDLKNKQEKSYEIGEKLMIMSMLDISENYLYLTILDEIKREKSVDISYSPIEMKFYEHISIYSIHL
ncbi:MAG: hypothetical protein U9R42_05805 [Bacteroidota bacterium]|nr:hypothetical protein [Bacteroidota bacterium]